MTPRPLAVHLLGSVEIAAMEAGFRRLVYDVSGGGCPALILCEHPAGITVGRDGSRVHNRHTPEELEALRWPVRWLARGGGVMLHVPGQVACYPVLPLAEIGCSPAGYVTALVEIAMELCRSFGVPAEPDFDTPGVIVGRRRVASVGVAVRSGVTAFGMVVNATPDLKLFRDVDCDGHPAPMTSLQRECPTPVRPQAVRQRLVELVAARFGFDRVSVVSQPPLFQPKPTRHASASRSR
ncbi:MAG: lipoyl(octanoyl) transferase LipB [Fimbriiglobus sp.]